MCANRGMLLASSSPSGDSHPSSRARLFRAMIRRRVIGYRSTDQKPGASRPRIHLGSRIECRVNQEMTVPSLGPFLGGVMLLELRRSHLWDTIGPYGSGARRLRRGFPGCSPACMLPANDTARGAPLLRRRRFHLPKSKPVMALLFSPEGVIGASPHPLRRIYNSPGKKRRNSASSLSPEG